MHLSSKMCCILTKRTALFSILVDSSACNAYYDDSLILYNNWISISSAMSLIFHVIVLAERGRCLDLLAAVLPSILWQISFPAGRINSSPIVKGFFALAIWSATKYGTLNALMFTDVAALSSCYCQLAAAVFPQNI